MDKMNCGVVLLAGGKSKRMGKDKWMLPMGEQTILEHLIETLLPLCAELWVIAASKRIDEIDVLAEPQKSFNLSRRYPNLHFTNDQIPEIGPLGGMATGFAQCKCQYILVASSDLPFPSAPLASALFALCQASHAMAALSLQGGRLHPLYGVYHKDTLASLTKYIASGGRKVMDWVNQLEVIVLSEPQLESLDPQGTVLFNMNRPEQYWNALQLFSEMKAKQ